MKKTRGALLLALMLTMTLTAPAMAATTGVAVDGKEYVFYGESGTFEVDGKTFIIGENTLTIQEAGKDDLVLELVHELDADIAATQNLDDAITYTFTEEGTDNPIISQSSHTVEAQAGDDAITYIFTEEGTDDPIISQSSHSVEAQAGDDVTTYTFTEEDSSAASVHQEATIYVVQTADGNIAYGIMEDDSDAPSIVQDVETPWGQTSDSYMVYGEIAEDAEDVILQYSTSTTINDELANYSERFNAYAQYGLSFDSTENVLYYQGERVRIFEDIYPTEDQASVTTVVAIENIDFDGTVDVQTQRDADGNLTGLSALSDKEFTTRDLSTWTTLNVATAVEGVELTTAEKKAIYGAYARFGLTYDVDADTLSYQGKTVRKFLDIKQTNGEALNSGRFEGVMTSITNEAGEIDVEAIRDYTNLDVDGNGTLTGLSVKQAQ